MSDMFSEKNVSPMLLHQAEPFDDENYVFELKLDGIRCIAYLQPSGVVLQNKRHKDVTETYPELSQMCKCVKHKVVLDGELVCLVQGKPNFFALQTRSLMQNKFKIKLAAQKNPVQFCVFDILYYNGKNVTQQPLLQRKALLQKVVSEGNGLSISRFVETLGIAFFQLAKQQQLEGVVAKKKDGLYHVGKRTREWLKIKVMQDEDLLVCGYQADEKGMPKDLVLGYCDEKGNLKCRGKVYLGVSQREREIIRNFAQKHPSSKPHFAKYKNVVWMQPKLVGTAHFMHQTESGGMRQPVWKGLRTDA